ncbi:MAG TPA: mechanosensitive ion channel domain-containing protein [Opitutaceae bacterium]|nr:mechanosensitive ion channel domain-containing protein [Opitutaceae bacterium]
MSNPPPVSPLVQMHDSVMGRIYGHYSGHDSSTATRLFLIVALAVAAHLVVKVVRHVSEWVIYRSHAKKSPLDLVTQQPKFITLTRLIVSGIVFAIYFFALGLVLQELGVNLTAYLASASVVGLAISFGSQGLVQDIVIGLTVIFWDAMDVGDMVEIAGVTNVIGRVEEIGLRFTKLTNLYNQRVFVPNRTIANVSRFPHGGIDAYADVWIPGGADQPQVVQLVERVAQGMWGQFGAIILSEPVVGEVETPPGGGWSYFRVHFKIWPGQGSLIETTFRQQVVKVMKDFDPAYADWQVPVTYRAVAGPQSVSPGRKSSSGGATS